MGSGSESLDLGKHLLGPHVVGQRVVVRRVLPGEVGPSGGPAMTDLLGICVAWTETDCVVQPESGPAVSIPLSLIVSGKPVPPRPSVRQRVSARSAESHVASLWPRLEVVPLGAWTLRFDPAPVGRVRRRANSCLAMGDPELPFPEATEAITAFYTERGRQPLAQVEAHSEVEQLFLDAGWSPLADGEAHFELASLARVRRSLGAVGSAELSVTGRTARAGLLDGGTEIASGEATVDGDWLGIHDVIVDAAHRRRGLARNVLATVLEWGAEQGATTAWLHVETDNAPALALYESVGFAPHHTCRYLQMTVSDGV
jgi:N-acetylglutamate synthase